MNNLLIRLNLKTKR